MEGSSNHPLGWTAGAIVDNVLGYLGILIFRDSLIASWLCPPWLIALWMIFATTFQSSLSWRAGRYWIAAVSGGIFGPVSYYAGQALGALTGGVADGAPVPWRSDGVSLSCHVAAFQIQGESSSGDEEESLGGLPGMSFWRSSFVR